MKDRIKILFVLDCLKGGGAQRAFVNIINGLDKDKYNIELGLVKNEGEFKDLISENIKIHDLNCTSARFALFKLRNLIIKCKPDILFSTLTYINELCYLVRKLMNHPPPIMVRCANYQTIEMNKESILVRLLAKNTYRSSDAVIALTEAMKRDLVDNFTVQAAKVCVIPNMVDIEYIKKLSNEPVVEGGIMGNRATPLITALGRLEEQKGMQYLIRGFALLRKKHRARLMIIGQGSLQNSLVKDIERFGLEQDVFLAGFKINPYKYIARSDIFVLPSLWEGFPNALIEAMACRVPVVASDCLSGPSEILTPGINGILVSPGKPEELNEALIEMVENEKLRRSLAEAGYESVKEYSNEKIILKYEEEINKLYKSKNG